MLVYQLRILARILARIIVLVGMGKVSIVVCTKSECIMCVYMCVHVYTCVYMCVYICMYVCMCVHMSLCDLFLQMRHGVTMTCLTITVKRIAWRLSNLLTDQSTTSYKDAQESLPRKTVRH